MRDEGGGSRWLKDCAAKTYIGEITDILEAANDRSLLHRAQLLSKDPRCDQLLLHPEVALAVCNHVWQYSLSLAGHELIWLRRYSDELPGMFALLVEDLCRESISCSCMCVFN